MDWIDWVILGAVGALVAGIVVYLIKQKKKGKGGCGCGCSGCPHAGACSSVPAKHEPSENKAN